MSPLDLRSPRLAFILDSLTAACRIALRVQSSTSSGTLHKADRSPVTVADFSVQALLGRRLLETFPDEPLVAEESIRLLEENPGILTRVGEFLATEDSSGGEADILDWIDHGSGQPASGFWTLDPIDGTKGFLRGEQFATALAWIQEGQVEVAGLGCPRLGRPGSKAIGLVYLAERGRGCYRAHLGQRDFQRCAVSECDDLQAARLLRSVEKSHTNVDLFSRLLAQIGSRAEPVLMDSQAKYAALASGWGDAVIRLQSQPDYREKIWDQAAGSLVVEEAAGRVTDQEGKRLDFSRGKRLEGNRGVVASNAQLHSCLIALLQGESA